jgi:molecular chaperone Hsp33
MDRAADADWDDMILPFQLDRSDVRGRTVRLAGTLDTILAQHAYPGPVSALVAEAAILSALIGPTLKAGWKLSLQIRGDGPIRIIATDYFCPKNPGDEAALRAYASFDADRLAGSAGSPFDLIGKGMFAVLIDQGEGGAPYSGITPLAHGSLSACAETYFAQSEQLATRFNIAVARSTLPGGEDRWRAGGVLLQLLPKRQPASENGGSGEGGLLLARDVLQGEEEENWTRANILLETAEETELLGPLVTPQSLLIRLFHEETPRVFPAFPIRFGCTCGPDKVRQAMSIYSQKDIAHMTNDQGRVTAECQFCGRHYEFAPETLGFEGRA